MFFKAEHFVRNLRDNKRFCPCRTKCLCFAYPHVPFRVSRLPLRVCVYAFWALRFLFLHNSRAESPKALSSGQSVSVAPSEAIPHYFRTVRAKALNMADFGKPNRRFVWQGEETFLFFKSLCNKKIQCLICKRTFWNSSHSIMLVKMLSLVCR